MFYLIYLLQIISAALIVESGETHYHKISMVSSFDHPDKPALFLHGESPVWDAKTRSLLFVDVHSQAVHRLDYDSGKLFTKKIGYGQVNIVSLIAHSPRLLVSVRSALFVLDWDVPGDAALRLLTTVDQGLPDNVLNEGKPDAGGRFWAGTKGPQTGDEVLSDKGTLYSFDHAMLPHPRAQLRPVSISNGLAWSLNNSIMYYVDSTTQKIEAFDYDLRSGELSGRRKIIDVSDLGYDDAIPDGLTIDSEGNLWVAVMFGGVILHVNPDSRSLIFEYKLPVSRVTSLAWGGPNLDELFVTTARDNLNFKEEPLGGAVFTIRGTGSKGIPANAFRFDDVDRY